MHDSNVAVVLREKLLEDLLVFAVKITGRNAFRITPDNIWKYDYEILIIDQFSLNALGIEIFEKFKINGMLFDVIVIDGDQTENSSGDNSVSESQATGPINSLESLLERLNRAEASGRSLHDWVGSVTAKPARGSVRD